MPLLFLLLCLELSSLVRVSSTLSWLGNLRPPVDGLTPDRNYGKNVKRVRPAHSLFPSRQSNCLPASFKNRFLSPSLFLDWPPCQRVSYVGLMGCFNDFKQYEGQSAYIQKIALQVRVGWLLVLSLSAFWEEQELQGESAGLRPGLGRLIFEELLRLVGRFCSYLLPGKMVEHPKSMSTQSRSETC